MKDIFESHPVLVLKKEISKTNIKGYSKMKKTQVIELMMKNKDRFSHIKMAEKKERKKPEKKPEKKIKLKPEKKPEKKIKLKPEKKEVKEKLKLEDNVNWRITAQDALRSIHTKKQIIKHLDESQQKDIFGKYQAMLDDAKKTNNIEKFKKIYFDLNVMKRSKKIQLPLTPNEAYRKQQEEKRKIEKQKRDMIPEDKEVKPLLNKLNDKINMMQQKYHKYNMLKSNRKEYQTVLKKHYEDSMKVFKELRSYKMSPEQIKKYKVAWKKLTTHMNSIFK